MASTASSEASKGSAAKSVSDEAKPVRNLYRLAGLLVPNGRKSSMCTLLRWALFILLSTYLLCWLALVLFDALVHTVGTSGFGVTARRMPALLSAVFAVQAVVAIGFEAKWQICDEISGIFTAAYRVTKIRGTVAYKNRLYVWFFIQTAMFIVITLIYVLLLTIVVFVTILCQKEKDLKQGGKSTATSSTPAAAGNATEAHRICPNYIRPSRHLNDAMHMNVQVVNICEGLDGPFIPASIFSYWLCSIIWFHAHFVYFLLCGTVYYELKMANAVWERSADQFCNIGYLREVVETHDSLCCLVTKLETAISKFMFAMLLSNGPALVALVHILVTHDHIVDKALLLLLASPFVYQAFCLTVYPSAVNREAGAVADLINGNGQLWQCKDLKLRFEAHWFAGRLVHSAPGVTTAGCVRVNRAVLFAIPAALLLYAVLVWQWQRSLAALLGDIGERVGNMSMPGTRSLTADLVVSIVGNDALLGNTDVKVGMKIDA